MYILNETGICYISIVLGNKKDGVTVRCYDRLRDFYINMIWSKVKISKIVLLVPLMCNYYHYWSKGL